MAISPPGDIVMDVIRAADPRKVEAAHEKLRAKAGGADFDFDFSAAAGGRADMRASMPASAKPPDAFVQFEAMVLQSFLDSMLPKDMGTVYGDGLSGEMWRGILAQQLGETLAKRGGIGVAERVLGNHYVEDGEKVPVAGVSSGPEHEQTAKQASLSSALMDEMDRRTAESLSHDAVKPSAKKE